MTDRPILFSGPMVRALLEGRKTQTRRVLKVKETNKPRTLQDWSIEGVRIGPLPYAVGDRLWVREAHYLTDDGDYEQAVCAVDGSEVADHLAVVARLEASHPTIDWSRHKRLRPGIHMPRWASRLTLTVTDVRVQRVQEISPEDAAAEGVNRRSLKVRQMWLFGANAQEREAIYLRACPWEFEDLWNAINSPRGYGWDANPWVVAITFTVERRNIDEASQ